MARRRPNLEMLQHVMRQEDTMRMNTPSTDSIVSLAMGAEQQRLLAQGPTPLNLPSKSQGADDGRSAYALLLLYVVFIGIALLLLWWAFIRRNRSGFGVSEPVAAQLANKEGSTTTQNVPSADTRPAEDVVCKHDEVHDEAAHSQLTEDTLAETPTTMSATPTEKFSHKRTDKAVGGFQDAQEARNCLVTPTISNAARPSESRSQIMGDPIQVALSVPTVCLVTSTHDVAAGRAQGVPCGASGGGDIGHRVNGGAVDRLVPQDIGHVRQQEHAGAGASRGGSSTSICSNEVEGGRRSRSLFSGDKVRLVRRSGEGSLDDDSGGDSTLHISRCRSLSPGRGTSAWSRSTSSRTPLRRGKVRSSSAMRNRALSPQQPRSATNAPVAASPAGRRALSRKSRSTVKSAAVPSARRRALSPLPGSATKESAPRRQRALGTPQRSVTKGSTSGRQRTLSPRGGQYAAKDANVAQTEVRVKLDYVPEPGSLDHGVKGGSSTPSKERSSSGAFALGPSSGNSIGRARVLTDEDDARTLDTSITLSTLNTLNTNGGFERIMREINQIQSERDTMRSELEAAKIQLQASALPSGSANDGKGNLQFELEWAREELEKARSKIAYAESERDGLRVHLEKSAAELHVAHSKTNVMRTELEVSHKKSSQLQLSVNQMMAERVKAAETLQLLKQKEGECNACEARMGALVSETERIQKEHDCVVDSMKSSYAQEIEGLKFNNRVMRSRLLALAERGNIDSGSMLGREYEQSPVTGEKQYDMNDPAVIRALLEERDEKISDMESKLTVAEEERRKLNNHIQELQGSIRVYVRVRPFVSIDDLRSHVQVSTPINIFVQKEKLAIRDQARNEDVPFSFDKVFSPSAGQEEVFDEIAGVVQSAIDGYNVCIFAYGQTGSGKTHTMLGYGNGTMRGLIPRAAEKILEQARFLHKWKFHIKASFVEIYNEKLRDLLTDDQTKLAILKDEDGKTFVDGLSCVDIDPYDDRGMDKLSAVMSVAARARSRSDRVTTMNETSSRSHSIFMLDILGFNADTGTIVNGSLNMCDLAGSERLHRSRIDVTMDAKHLKETQSINKSLSCLGDVFNALATGASHIPFRNSKLTYLLQDCFSGDGKALMIVNLSPTIQSSKESLCSLRFAQRVNSVELGRAVKHVKQAQKS